MFYVLVLFADLRCDFDRSRFGLEP